MDDNNLIKKKKKSYYRYHNNQNKNYYYKKKKKNLMTKNNDSEEVGNILLYNSQNNKIIEEEPQKKQEEIIEQEPERKIVQVIKENSQDYEEIDLKPIRKGSKKNIFERLFGTNLFKYGLGLTILVIAVIGVSYSFFTYREDSSKQGDISSGEVYVKLVEQTANLTLNRLYPRTNEEARSRDDNYIDFTIKAKNTSETNEVVYSINITNGENVTGKTRINPDYLLIDLQEVNGNNYTYIKEAEPLSSFSFSSKVPVNTTSEITKVYRLRVWVSDDIIISDTEPNATYTQTQFANLYGNLHIEVNSEDKEREPTGEEKVREAITAKINAETNSCNPIWVDDNGTASDETDDITYFSGTNDCVDMNYVWYSGKLWRITAIYPDGAMKLVTENDITSIAFNASEQVNFYTDSNTTSYMYQWLNEDFYDTLYNANQLIDTSKQWNATMPSDTNVSTKPLETNMVTANVGLLNNYEYYNSYRCISSATCTGSNYSTGYLNIGYYWWLLNPYNASYVWEVYNGGGGNNSDPTNANGARPSIYLKSGLVFTGDGSKQSPYKIVGDKDTGAANELINTRISGEYVKLKNGNNEQLFRIIGVEDNKAKIIAMDYADNKATKKFAVGNTSGDGTIYGTGQTATQGEDTWYNYLTGTYEPNLETTYGPLFDSSTYYMGQVGSGQSYKLGICSSSSGLIKNCPKTSQVGTFNIGLPRYGEMFATQQSGGGSNSTTMLLINRYSASYVWFVSSSGDGNYNSPTRTYGARPTVHLKSGVKIISGTGIETDPYVVEL